MRTIIYYLVALASGAIGVFAFSPFDIWAIAYVSLIGLLFISIIPAKKTALWASFIWGLSFFSIGVNWLHVSIHQFGGAPLIISYLLVILLSAYLALYPVLFTYLIRRFNIQKLAMFPVVWTLTEWLRAWVFTGFPWLQFGYSQIDSPFAAIAPIFGITGLTFFTMWASAVIFNSILVLIKPPRKINVVISNSLMLIVIAGLSIYLAKKDYTQPLEQRAVTITLAQGNIEQNLKWDPAYLQHTLDVYFQQIYQHLDDSDIIVLPEAAFPVLENNIAPLLIDLQQKAKAHNTEIIIGTVYRNPELAKLFNSIIVLGNENQPYNLATANRYNKHHLVPFGEFVPLEKLLRPLGSVFNLPMSAFQAGKLRQSPLATHDYQFSPAICYEIIFGKQLQQNLTPTTDFILTISNDAWFGNSIGPWQHLQMARMRALELGKPVIRATNTGISVFINAQGKILAQAPQFEQTTLTYKIAPVTGRTPYAVFGNTPIYILCAILTALWLVGSWLRNKILYKG